MKHLQAGATVAIIALVVIAVGAVVWNLLSGIGGPGFATGAIILTFVVFIGATVIDRLTEKK